MHTAVILTKSGTELTRLFQGPNMRDLEYSREISKAGSARFRIKTLDTKATATNLALFNRVKIYKGTSVKWSGYISNLRVNTNEIIVTCTGLLGILKKRIYSSGYIASSDVQTVVSNMMTSINSADDTGISIGTNAITTAVLAYELNRSTGFDALNALTNIGGGEFEVDTSDQLNVVEELGTDKSATVILRYDENNIPLSTIYEFDVEVDSDDMANQVIGVGSGVSPQTVDDATSQSAYGLLQEAKNFGDVGNTSTLAAAAQGYLDNVANEFYVPSITPNIDQIDTDTFDVGDTVGVKISAGFIDLDQDHRITKKTVTVSDNGTEKVDIDITPEGVNKLPSTFIDSIIDLQERMRLLEGNL